MKHVFFIAGESSGDMHGANLIRALRLADPTIRCAGLGGRRMAEAGMELIHDLAGDAIMGFVEVLKRVLPLRRLFLDTVAQLQKNPPDCLVLIDYPGFNIRLARAAYDLGIPIVYYISPQVWAWKKKRIDVLARLVRKMLVIFPFEEALYRDKGVDCVYVGHPLVDELATYQPPPFDEKMLTIGLLPGSREQEIRRIAPVMRAVAEGIRDTHPDARFMIPCVSESRAEQVRAIMNPLDVEIRVGGMYEVLSRARCCLVASGTATVETTLFGVPMGIVYRVNPISYYLARLIVHVRHIGMVNILAEREVAPEFIQGDATVKRILPFMLDIIEDGERRDRMLTDLREIKKRFGASGASQRAAEQILQVLNKD